MGMMGNNGPIEKPEDLEPAIRRGIETVKRGEPVLIDVARRSHAGRRFSDGADTTDDCVVCHTGEVAAGGESRKCGEWQKAFRGGRMP